MVMLPDAFALRLFAEMECDLRVAYSLPIRPQSSKEVQGKWAVMEGRRRASMCAPVAVTTDVNRAHI